MRAKTRSVPSGIYRHFKGGLYLVERTITDASSGPRRPKAELPRRVVYWALYDDFEPWGRELSDFRSSSYRRLDESSNERLVKRFKLVCRMDQVIPPAETLEIAKNLKTFLHREKREVNVARAIITDQHIKPGAILVLLKQLKKELGQ